MDLLCQAVSSWSSLAQMRSSGRSSASPTPSINSSDDSNAVGGCFIGSTCSTRISRSRTISRRCGFPECQKTAKRGGFCIAHGGGKKCSVEGCSTSVVSRGVCVAHGGGKRCQAPACAKSAQTGGFCWIHGGGKKCGVQDCKKRAQSGGACISHGGGKRCRMEGCNKVVQYDGLCVGHGGYRKCLSLKCDKRALANSYCQVHGGNSMCRVAGCRKRAIHGGICSDHKAPIPVHIARTSAAFARCRPSIDLPETPFKVEPIEIGREHYRDTTTPCKASPEPRGPTTYSRMDLDSPPGRSLWPLQYVRRGASLLGDGRTIATPIFKHFNGGKQYDPYRTPRLNLPVLPSFQTLQRSCSTSLWSEPSERDWSSPESTSNEGVEDSRASFPIPIQQRADELTMVSLGRNTCNVPGCSRHAKRNGLCLLHGIVSASK